MIEFHAKLLGDGPRNSAFAAALKKLIVPGQTIVADIGSGTGFLSFLAQKYGAKACYLYESDPDLLDLSRKIAQKNNIKNCFYIPGHSTEIKHPVKADLVISETLGNYALEENVIETLADAKRFLKPGGVVVPSNLEQFIVPVTNSRIYNETNIWDGIGFDLNFEKAKECALNNMYVYRVSPSDILGGKDSVKKWDEVIFTNKEASIRNKKAAWKAEAGATVYGFAIWWNCTLAPGIAFSTSPFAVSTHWDQIFLPLMSPVKLEVDDILEVDLKSDSRYSVGIRLSWETRVFGAKDGKLKSEISMDTSKGL